MDPQNSNNLNQIAFDGGMSPSKLLNDHADQNLKFLSLEKKLKKMNENCKITRNDAQKLKVSSSLPE